MSTIEHRLTQSGLLLFVFGLAFGFALRAFPNPRAALSAHLNAVQSGTFLLVLGLLWPRLAVWRSVASPLAHLIWLSFWGLEAGMVLAAFVPAAGAAAAGATAPRALKLSVTALQAVSAIAMLIGVGALLFTFRPTARTPEPGPLTGAPQQADG